MMSIRKLMTKLLPSSFVFTVAVVATGFGLSVTSIAEETPASPEFCSGCHETAPMLGVHSGNRFGTTNLVAACIDCHGVVTDLALHEKDASDVLRFNATSLTLPLVVNDRCLTCHKPQELRSAHWTHDAHGSELACTSCHALHSSHDPVRGISQKSTIQLCVTCHAEKTRVAEGAK